MPDTTVKLQDITPVKSTFDNDDQLLLINPTGEARINKEDFLDAMPDDAITLIGDITTTGIEGDTAAKQLGALENSKAPAITETTESSAIANFTDGADDLVMHNIVVEINPVQDLSNGGPSPTNICPITGHTGVNVTRTGKNLFNYDAWIGVAVQRGTAVFENNGVTLTATANDAFTWYDSAFPSGARIPVKEGETIILSWEESTNTYGGVYIFPNGGTTGLVTVNNAYAKQLSYTATSGVTYVTFRFGVATSGTTISYKNIMVRPASLADSTYEPYVTPSTVTLSWQTEAGTVYGGTIDVATGLLTVTMKALESPESLSWSWQSAYNVFNYRPPSANAFKDNGKVVSSAYAYGGEYSHLSNYECGYIFTNHLAIRDDRFNGDVDAFKASLSGVQIFYELATPQQTYQLTGQQLMTLYGNNSVWADTGNVSVTYPADTKMFIEKLTQPTEDDLVANQAIASGTFFMVGNNLYLATAAIASGATIIEGTNATRLSLADALNRLS